MNCTTCQQEIPESRLKALPHTKVCILCSLEAEIKVSEPHLASLFDALQLQDEVLVPVRDDAYSNDERADSMLGRQLERIEGFDES